MGNWIKEIASHRAEKLRAVLGKPWADLLGTTANRHLNTLSDSFP